MHQSIIVTVLFFSFSLVIGQSKLNPEQSAWLYRITQKTPVLQRNWNTFITFDKTPFTRSNINGTVIDYDAIEYYQSHNAEELNIDWSALATSSPGLIAEASTLLALYELNQLLLKVVQHGATEDSTYLALSKKLKVYLPAKTKKAIQITQTVVHPSLPLKIKTGQLDKFRLNAEEQKKLLNGWRTILNNYLQQRSQHFFTQLSSNGAYYEMLLLAAGEGSGTAGLLYEQEKHPDGDNKRWYGKGIGLFTYEMRVRNNEVLPRENTQSQVKNLKAKQNSLHLSLWGLNSSFKPLVVVTVDNKSYHLFSDFKSKELSPDPRQSTGISFIDRIEQNRQKLIAEPLNEIQGEGSLSSILEKENASKAKIEAKLTQLEGEIDSLQQLVPVSENAINYRRKSINSLLSSLSDKTERIARLEKKLSEVYRNIDRAETTIANMTKQLGPNPQTWTEVAGRYTFADGVIFDKNSQDLIFENGTSEKKSIKIHLLSASYNLKGAQRDEVQLLVNSTSAPKAQKVAQAEGTKFMNDTIIQNSYFYPDAFTLNELSYASFSLICAFPDTLPYSIQLKSKPIKLLADNPITYADLKRERQVPITEMGKQRYALFECIRTQDEVQLIITSSCDPVPTRLSQLPESLRQKLNITESSVSNNHYLSVLRGLYILHAYFGYKQVENIELHYPISKESIRIIWEHVISIPPPAPVP